MTQGQPRHIRTSVGRTSVGIAAVAALLLTAGAAAAQPIPAEPIPPGYNFPTARATVNGWVATNNFTAIRGHAWDLWAGMTVDSRSTYNGQRLPIWETWYSTQEVFGLFPITAAVRTKPSRPFIAPAQFSHIAAAALSEAAKQVLSFNKYNIWTAFWDVTPHNSPSGPPGVLYHYTKKSSLTALNATWGATSLINRKILDFPNQSIELKPVFFLVKASALLTPVPFWQGAGPSHSSNQQHPSPGTWYTCVLIAPGGAGGLRVATPQEIQAAYKNNKLSCQTYLYAPLDMIYSFRMDADEAKAWNDEQGEPGMVAEPNDYAVLVAMHVNTKEIVNWTWQTFWWQGGLNPPNRFPGSTANMPGSVKGPWRNYAMCPAYSQTTTPGGTVLVCFNPYLETSSGIPDGLNSNCMTCHGTARIPQSGVNFYPPNYKQPVKFGDPAYFSGNTKTDFSWATALNPK